MSNAKNELLDYINALEIIDTHEHLPRSDEARDRDTDVLKEYLLHYFNRDLISAGLSAGNYDKVIDSSLPLMDRWKLVEPYWSIAKHTGYGRALTISASALYGINDICRSTIEELNEAFQDSLKPGHFKKVLKDKSRIKVSLLDSDLECDRLLFRSVYRLDNFVYPKTADQVRAIEKGSGLRICSLEDWLQACETTLDNALSG